MNNIFYMVKCITNLHMGNGDINFNIVDNEVQRDTVTNYPAMYSSSVKGALREHITNCKAEIVTDVFGSDVKSSNAGGKDKSIPGKLKFMTGNILLLPIRAARGSMAYYLVTSKEILHQFGTMYQTIAGKEIIEGFLDKVALLDEKKAYAQQKEQIKIENHEYTDVEIMDMDAIIAQIFPDNLKPDCNKLLIVPDEDLRTFNLPVLARNQLENGISKNLWYEEVVPHEAIFYFSVLSNGTKSGDEALSGFDKVISEESLVQFGGNATVGYGLTKLKKF